MASTWRTSGSLGLFWFSEGLRFFFFFFKVQERGGRGRQQKKEGRERMSERLETRTRN